MAVLAVLTLPSLASAGTTAVDVGNRCVAMGVRKIAVAPTIFQVDADGNPTNAMGAQARSMASKIRSALQDLTKQPKYRFEVLSESIAEEKFKALGFEKKDLADDARRKKLADALGVDALAFGTYDASKQDEFVSSTNQDPFELLLDVEVVRLVDGMGIEEAKVRDKLTLSSVAYQGRSFEVRRWVGDSLQNVGLDCEPANAFGVGREWEHYQYKRLRAGLPHPERISDFPYPVSFFVNGVERPAQRVRSAEIDGSTAAANEPEDYVFEANDGDKLEIRLQNKSSKSVYVAVYVDGVSILDRKTVEPGELETPDHWVFGAGKPGAFTGWFDRLNDANGKKVFNASNVSAFVVGDVAKSVAASSSLDANLGMVTLVFYTYGLDGVPTSAPEPPVSVAQGLLEESFFGVGAGAAVKSDLAMGKNLPRGPMLAAVTYHYRPKHVVERLVSLPQPVKSTDPPVKPRKPEPVPPPEPVDPPKNPMPTGETALEPGSY